MEISLIGFDVKYPIEITEQGTPALVGGTSLLSQALKDRLLTPIGSRFFNRSYGSLLPRLLNEPNSQVAIPVIEEFVRECVAQEQRVSFVSAFISQIKDKLTLNLVCRQRNTNEIVSLNLEFSFFNI